ncbi:MAG: hypothetical protein JNG89_06980, partial [Planctomycetaceae bacterium]|nr:hypothetical protein [Planctomycetaceae bacterium]
MRTIPETEPIFAAIPDSPEERFDLVKQFALRWSGDPVVPPRGIAERIAAAEARLRIKLPLTLQLFYESGLRDWFATHCDELCREDWQELDKLDFDERSGDLTFYIAYIGVPKRGIRPNDLSISDPPVREIKDRGHFGG